MQGRIESQKKLKQLKRELNTIISLQKNTTRGKWQVSGEQIKQVNPGLPETKWPTINTPQDLEMMAASSSMARKYATLLRENIKMLENSTQGDRHDTKRH